MLLSTLASRIFTSPVARLERPSSSSAPLQNVSFSNGLSTLATSVFLCAKKTIRARAQHPLHNKPSRNWVYRFLRRHSSISFYTSSGLNPKRAKAFNEPVVSRFFDMLTDLVEKHEIPIENVYNMDQKAHLLNSLRSSQNRVFYVLSVLGSVPVPEWFSVVCLPTGTQLEQFVRFGNSRSKFGSEIKHPQTRSC
ncbi:hypothetical protein B0H14DRAFT_2412489 [Mycena olivaceomarginata]|nr:hypothetical protein B0H14DRAFT_2412489 [Mycena olivaceomarginata]